MSDPVNVIRHDYRAVHSSGSRPKSALRYFVVHDMEFRDPLKAAEVCGRYFSSAASGGSTQYGVDNDSTQQYLPCTVIPWGAVGGDANARGIHCECAGAASLTREQWRKTYGPMLERLAWLMWHDCSRFAIPLRLLTDDQLRRGEKGITTHRQITRVYSIAGGHTDPGAGFPLLLVLQKAKAHARKPLTAKQKRRLRWRLRRTSDGSLRWLRRVVNHILGDRA
jgi:hypothetical protein